MLQHLKKNDASDRVSAKERRSHPRYAVSAMAEAVDLQSDTRILGRISDIGEGGCYVEVMSPFGVGTGVRVKITKDDKSFAAQGKVRYSMGGMGMGLTFTNIEPSQRPVLERWIAELSGEVDPEPKAGPKEPETVSTGAGDYGQRYVLNELVIMLIRKRLLTDAEGKTLLQKLMQ